MSTFDSECDPTAPGRLVSADEIWRAVREMGQPGAIGRLPEPVASAEYEEVLATLATCSTCLDEGWIDGRIGSSHPAAGWFRCPDCGNPSELPQP